MRTGNEMAKADGHRENCPLSDETVRLHVDYFSANDRVRSSEQTGKQRQYWMRSR